MSQVEAAKEGYDQVLQCLQDNITEAGTKHFFPVLKRDDIGELNTGRPSFIPYVLANKLVDHPTDTLHRQWVC